MAKRPCNSSGSDGVKPPGSPTLTISSNVADQDLRSPPLCPAGEGANAPGAAEPPCRVPSGQSSLLILSSCQSWQPLLDTLEGHLKVVWQGNVDNGETHVTPSGVLLGEKTTSSCEAGFIKYIWNLHIFQKERGCRIPRINWRSLRKYFFLCVVHNNW